MKQVLVTVMAAVGTMVFSSTLLQAAEREGQALESVPVHLYRTCGQLSFDREANELLFRNYRVPGGERYAFRVTLFADTAAGRSSVFDDVANLFYKARVPGQAVDVDQDLAQRGVIVKVSYLEAPRQPLLKQNPAFPDRSYFSVAKDYYVQLVSVEKIGDADCQPLAIH